MKIKVTDFAKKHFDPKFGGTKVLNYTIEEFEKYVNSHLISLDIDSHYLFPVGLEEGDIKIINGYAPFCKLIAIRNFTDARVGSLPITLENYQYIRSGYSARREGELPVFSRWLELPIKHPKADWLMVVLYSHGHLINEAALNIGATGIQEEVPDCDYGIVAILGQSHPEEEPMKPETMIRNGGYNTEEYQAKAIEKIKGLYTGLNETEAGLEDICDEDIKEILDLQGKMVGGSGVPINRDKYLKSVDFWDKNITVN